MKIAGKEYKGVFLSQTDANTNAQTMTFSVVGTSTNNSIWGSKINYSDNQKEIEDGAIYFVQNAYSGFYLDVPNGLNDDGTNLHQWEFNGYTTQMFKFTSSDSDYRISSQCSDFTKFATVENNSANGGANIIMNSQLDNESQLFSVVPNNDGTFRILSKSSSYGQGVENYDFGVSNGSNVTQWEYWGGEQQHWILTKVEKAPAYIPAVITKHGANSSSQTLREGESLASFYFSWENAETVNVTGLPKGITTEIDNFAKTITFEGNANDLSGEYEYVISTVGGNPDTTRKGKITILAESTDIEDVKANNLQISVYPNPAKDFANLRISTQIKEEIIFKIYSINGELLYEKVEVIDPANNIVTINNDFNQVVILQIITTNEAKTIKILFN